MPNIFATKFKTLKTKVQLLCTPPEQRYSKKENYLTANADISWWEKHLNHILIQEHKDQLVGKMADFGCNHGACTILAARNSLCEDILGFDINTQAIEQALLLRDRSEESAAVKKKVAFKTANFKNIPVESAYFDSAMCFHSLEHIYPKDHDEVLSEFKRTLKRGAHFFISVPFENAYFDPIQHVAFFNVESLRALLDKNGFKVLTIARDQRKDAHSPDGHDYLNALCLVR